MLELLFKTVFFSNIQNMFDGLHQIHTITYTYIILYIYIHLYFAKHFNYFILGKR